MRDRTAVLREAQERDPRVDPRPGDEVRGIGVFGKKCITRRVTYVNPDPACPVLMCRNITGGYAKPMKIAKWREWAESGSVLKRGPDGA